MGFRLLTAIQYICYVRPSSPFRVSHGKGDVAPGVLIWIWCVSGQPQWRVGMRRTEASACSSGHISRGARVNRAGGMRKQNDEAHSIAKKD
jgi:hypothetical protein